MVELPDSSDITSGRDYDTLEEHILNTERNREEEKWCSVRLERWQINLADTIGLQIGTSKTEVYERAIKRGLKQCRETLEGLEKTRVMRANIFQAISIGDGDRQKLLDANVKLGQISIKSNNKVDKENELQDVIGLPVQESIYSEVKDQIIDNFGLDSGIYRLFLSVGLTDSEYCPEKYQKMTEELLNDYMNLSDRLMKELENFFVDNLERNYLRLEKSDIDKNDKQHLLEVLNMMETDKKQEAEKIINRITDEDYE